MKICNRIFEEKDIIHDCNISQAFVLMDGKLYDKFEKEQKDKETHRILKNDLNDYCRRR